MSTKTIYGITHCCRDKDNYDMFRPTSYGYWEAESEAQAICTELNKDKKLPLNSYDAYYEVTAEDLHVRDLTVKEWP